MMSVASWLHCLRDLGIVHLEDDRAVGVGDPAGATLPFHGSEHVLPRLGKAACDLHYRTPLRIKTDSIPVTPLAITARGNTDCADVDQTARHFSARLLLTFT